MPKFFEIPLTPEPQQFNITLSGRDYQITVKYVNVDEGGWVIDIADRNGVAIVSGITLVTGTDLLGQYKHLDFGGRLWVQTENQVDAVPTFENLGVQSFLFWVTD